MDTKRLNGIVFGGTMGMLALFITAILDMADVYAWAIVWPVTLIIASMVYVGYNIYKDMAAVSWKFKDAEIETKIDFAMMGLLTALLVVMILT